MPPLELRLFLPFRPARDLPNREGELFESDHHPWLTKHEGGRHEANPHHCRIGLWRRGGHPGGSEGHYPARRFRNECSDSLTAQNTVGVQAIHEVPAPFVESQIDSVLSDIGADAIKTGMLANAEIIEVVAKKIRQYRVGRWSLIL